MATALSPEVKRRRGGVDHSPTSRAKVKERVEQHLYFPSMVFMDCSRVNFKFIFTFFYSTLCQFRSDEECFTETKSSVHLISDQNLEETRNKECLRPSTINRATSGQSNLIGTRG